ncbi:MAG: AAA family ATPase [Bacteroidia bacterium]|nr:AAA family ATPase [Bacteroidia bacterium]MBP9724668.1 AAA family ATPase [Bacteroidia bacterium]
MTLKQINKIRDFGIFEKFDWDNGLHSFKLFNLSYGWNYSGKTTLSRILRSFETGVKHPDYPTSTFEVEDTGGTKFSETHFPNKLQIRVFNSDFISENLKWNENASEIEPILLLGVQNITLQQELATEKANLTTEQEAHLQLIAEKKAEEDRMFYALSNKARDIKSNLVLTTFDKRHFEPEVVAAAAATTSPTLLSDEEVSKLTTVYKSTDKKSDISKINFSIPKIADIHKSANDLLASTVKAKVIERLKDNQELNEWVKKGKDLHQGKTTCEFCSNELPIDLLENLSNHFSKDYDNLLENLQNEIQKNEKSKIVLTLPDAANFYPELQSDYMKIRALLEKQTAELNQVVKSMNDKLEAKKVKAFEKLECGAVTDNTQMVAKHLDELNQIVEKHNQKTLDFDKEKSEAYQKLITNYANEFAANEKYNDSIKKIADTQEKITQKDAGIKVLEMKIIGIEQQLSETVKGAEKINDYLKQYFGKQDIKVTVTLDNKFQLQRATKVAKNLSEGEKTAIAFAYFITRLEDKNTTLSNTVVYIDDPISSLDTNHLFNTYSFIKDKFYFFDSADTTGNKHKCKAAQFFISTHNFEFFNLIKDWYNDLKEKDKSFYLIERTTNSTKDESCIKALPIELLKFKSEYTYLFSIINSFKTSPTTDFGQLYNLPNITRRFIETFTAFKYLSTRNIEQNLERLVADTVKREMLRKFVHYNSHSLTTTKLIQFTDPTECIKVVDILLDSIKLVDEEHYNSLIAEVAPTPAPTATVATTPVTV